MIQLYLLVLIIIFVVILVTIKEKFQNNAECKDESQMVQDWPNDASVFLYGCNAFASTNANNDSLSTNANNDSLSQLSIILYWKNNDLQPDKIILIVNTEDDDDTFIKDITNDHKDVTDTNSTKPSGQPIKTFELIDNIIEGKTYFITINYIVKETEGQTINVSNTLKITAISPVPHFKSSGFKLQQQNLMNLLRNKTFDIYL